MKYQIARVSPKGKVDVVGKLATNDGKELLKFAQVDNASTCTLMTFTKLPVVVCADGTRYYVR